MSVVEKFAWYVYVFSLLKMVPWPNTVHCSLSIHHTQASIEYKIAIYFIFSIYIFVTSDETISLQCQFLDLGLTWARIDFFLSPKNHFNLKVAINKEIVQKWEKRVRKKKTRINCEAAEKPNILRNICRFDMRNWTFSANETLLTIKWNRWFSEKDRELMGQFNYTK